MRPRILASLPKTTKEWVELRAQAGSPDPSHVLVFYLYKLFAPGSPNDKDALLKRVLNPNVCTNPQSAQLELMRWRTDVDRLQKLGCMPPDIMISYRALESIFVNVFDKAEPQLNLRWNQLKNSLGLPLVITPKALLWKLAEPRPAAHGQPARAAQAAQSCSCTCRRRVWRPSPR